MPRDYFDLEDDTKDVISDNEKQDKVLEFIAQVSRNYRYIKHIYSSYF